MKIVVEPNPPNWITFSVVQESDEDCDALEAMTDSDKQRIVEAIRAELSD